MVCSGSLLLVSRSLPIPWSAARNVSTDSRRNFLLKGPVLGLPNLVVPERRGSKQNTGTTCASTETDPTLLQQRCEADSINT